MKKIPVILFAILATNIAFAQTTTPKKLNLSERAADHFVLQLATNIWSGAPDSVTNYIKGFNRSANFYVMYDIPFKSNPKFSAAIGIGVTTSNIYFKKMEVDVTANSPKLPFTRTDTGFNFKKYKVATSYLEIPLEIRFMSKPEDPNKSMKFAIGVKGGILLNAHTKGKNLQNSAGVRINNAVVKESQRSYFKSSRLAATARVGYGAFSLFGSYNITNVFKDGVAADTKLIQVGLSISGL
jgi:Outer membrane protein beta-barrel domain